MLDHIFLHNRDRTLYITLCYVFQSEHCIISIFYFSNIVHFYPQTEIQREVLGCRAHDPELFARDVELMTQQRWRSTVWGQEPLVWVPSLPLTGSNRIPVS